MPRNADAHAAILHEPHTFWQHTRPMQREVEALYVSLPDAELWPKANVPLVDPQVVADGRGQGVVRESNCISFLSMERDIPCWALQVLLERRSRAQIANDQEDGPSDAKRRHDPSAPSIRPCRPVR